MQISLVSSFHDIPNEIHVLNLLFCEGLEVFHLRKNRANGSEIGHDKVTEERLRDYIEKIPDCFRDRIILHSNFNLVQEYGLRGAHFTKRYEYADYLKDSNTAVDTKPFRKIGFSLHSTTEIETYSCTYDYLFLSPVFDSISNIGYNSKFNLTRLKKFLNNVPCKSKIIALGGMNDTKVEKVNELGFNGLSLLGFIWSHFEDNQDIVGAVNRYRRIEELRKQAING